MAGFKAADEVGVVFKAAGIDHRQRRQLFESAEDPFRPGVRGDPGTRTAGGEIGIVEEIAGHRAQSCAQARECQAARAGPGADHIRFFDVIKRCHEDRFSGRNFDSYRV